MTARESERHYDRGGCRCARTTAPRRCDREGLLGSLRGVDPGRGRRTVRHVARRCHPGDVGSRSHRRRAPDRRRVRAGDRARRPPPRRSPRPRAPRLPLRSPGDPPTSPARRPGALPDREGRRATRPSRPRSCRCRRRATRRTASPSSKRHALGRHLQPDPRGEEREAHVGPVERSRSPRLRDEVLELLPSLPVEHGFHRSSTASRCASPRTSAATASVTARHAVRQRSSQCVIAESAGASSSEQLRARRSEGSERRAVHHGAVPGRDLRPSLGHVPLRGIRDAVPDAAEHASREGPDIRRIGGQPVQVPPQHVVRVQPSALRERAAEVARHRRVVGPRARAGDPIQPCSNAGSGSGISLAPAELERRPERVPERQPEDASHHPFPQVIHRFGAYRHGPQQGPLVA